MSIKFQYISPQAIDTSYFTFKRTLVNPNCYERISKCTRVYAGLQIIAWDGFRCRSRSDFQRC